MYYSCSTRSRCCRILGPDWSGSDFRAGEYSGEVFNQAQQIASSTGDPALRNLLREVLVTRDQITADLAKGDPAALSEIQRLLSNLEQTAKH